VSTGIAGDVRGRTSLFHLTTVTAAEAATRSEVSAACGRTGCKLDVDLRWQYKPRLSRWRGWTPQYKTTNYGAYHFSLVSLPLPSCPFVPRRPLPRSRRETYTGSCSWAVPEKRIAIDGSLRVTSETWWPPWTSTMYSVFGSRCGQP